LLPGYQNPIRSIARLQARLLARFRLLDVPLTLPISGVTYRILQPAAFDRLLTAAARDPEQNLPYWATIWPSGIALAELVLARRPQLAGARVLEIGSGLGTTATAVIDCGADLLVTDYSSVSLLLCRANALRNTAREPQTLQLNWRDPSPALLHHAPFPLVLAADVLYEGRDVDPLLDLVERLVAPGGALWLAEPGRPPARRFVQAARARGWRSEVWQHPGPWPDPQDRDVIVNVHTFRRTDATVS
jgi:predicted nicotinamide N-methyase